MSYKWDDVKSCAAISKMLTVCHLPFEILQRFVASWQDRKTISMVKTDDN
jgi:hypothetical protein